MAILQQELYKSHPGINQSILKLIDSPWLVPINLNKRELKNEEDESYFSFGTFQDMLLCDDSTVWDKFIVIDLVSTGNYCKIIDKCFSVEKTMEDQKADLLTAFEEEYPNSRWKEDTRWENIKKYGEDYWKKKESIGTKTVITPDQYQIILHNHEQVYPRIQDLLHKVCLTADYKGINIKGELDHLDIDRNNKTWRVVDDKTTAEVYKFDKSVIKYRYDFQMAFYELLVELNSDELGLTGYTKLPGYWNVMSNSRKTFVRKIVNPFNAMKSGVNYYGKLIGVEEAADLYNYYTSIMDWTKTKEEHETGFSSIFNNVTYAK
jgi:hypothetical protein